MQKKFRFEGWQSREMAEVTGSPGIRHLPVLVVLGGDWY